MLLAAGPCDHAAGPAQDVCKGGGSPSSPTDPGGVLDPLSPIAHKVADAAAWCVEQVGRALDAAGTVDFTSTKFLQQYAIVFAASAILTLILWLIAVAKRAMRGVPLTTAFSEAVGFLWLTVMASAFTPLILQVTVSAVDAVTNAMTGSSGGMPQLFKTLAGILRQDGEITGGGPIILIVASLVTILLAGILGLELVVRAAALYLGALLGLLVYSGLVDRKLWSKVRMWAGVMIALILLKPIVMICLGIAKVFVDAQEDGNGPIIVAGNVVLIIAIMAGIAIFRFVPGYGDDIAKGLAIRATLGAAGGALKIGASAAGVVAQGIQTHGGRQGDSGGRQSGGQGGGKTSRVNGVADGMSTHSNRSPGKQKGKDSN